MMFKIKSTGNVVAADRAFMDAHYAGDYEIVPEVAAALENVAAPTRMTKAAFQNRFPKSADGISSKFSLMKLFLTDGDYSTFLVADAPTRFGLKALITEGLSKLDTSLSVDLGVPDAAMFTGLLAQPSIPAAFRLTAAERNAILHQPLQDSEVFK